jgi:hypothetical protein
MDRNSNGETLSLPRARRPSRLQARYFCYVETGDAAYEACGLGFARNDKVGQFTRA